MLPLGVAAGALAECGAIGGHHLLDTAKQRARFVGMVQEASLGTEHLLRHTAIVRGEHRRAARQGLERGQTERLVRTGRDVEVRRRMEVGDGFARPRVAEHHETGPREGLDPRAQ